MSSKKPVRPPMSPDDYAKHRRSQAEERARRGFPTFTRQSVREEVGGNVPGQNKLQRIHRKTQVDRTEDRRR